MKKIFLLLLFIPILTLGQCVLGDCENGYGVFKESNGDIYSGEWKEGKKTGLGYLQEMRGEDYYLGEFKENDRYGLGIDYNTGKDFYIGQMIKNQREGYGYLYLYLTDDSYHIGQFSADIKHGMGLTRDNKTNRWYFGEWMNGNPQDKKSKKGKKNLLQGCIVGKCKNGQGLYVSDRVILGNWVKGSIKGTGCLFTGGDVAVGEFRDDKLNGKSFYMWESSTMYLGIFSDGNTIGGNSIVRDGDGDVFIGETKDGGIYHGYGISIMYNKIKSSYEYHIGTWEDGTAVEVESYIFK
tara:strand:- start:194 stop:1078 length:885 start_codon:yes stop_codon:yes gene_type:complete